MRSADHSVAAVESVECPARNTAVEPNFLHRNLPDISVNVMHVNEGTSRRYLGCASEQRDRQEAALSPPGTASRLAPRKCRIRARGQSYSFRPSSSHPRCEQCERVTSPRGRLWPNAFGLSRRVTPFAGMKYTFALKLVAPVPAVRDLHPGSLATAVRSRSRFATTPSSSCSQTACHNASPSSNASGTFSCRPSSRSSYRLLPGGRSSSLNVSTCGS